MKITVFVVVSSSNLCSPRLQTSSDFCASPDTYVVKVANQYGVIKPGSICTRDSATGS